MCEKKKNDAYAQTVVPSCSVAFKSRRGIVLCIYPPFGVAFKSRRGIVQRKKMMRMHKLLFRLVVWLLKVAVGLSFAFIRLSVWLLKVAVGLSKEKK